MTFHVGQKVTMKPEYGHFWFHLENKIWEGGSDLPIMGEVYTIVHIAGLVVCKGVAEQVGLVLKEFSTPRDGAVDLYAAERFRPVVEKKTDISIFTEMLTPKTVETV